MRTWILVLTCVAIAVLAGAARADDEQSAIRIGTRSAEVVMTKITVANLRRSYDFYTNTLGLKEVPIPALPAPALDDPEVAFTEVALNFSGSLADAHLVLVKKKGLVPTAEQAKLTWIGIKVADASATLERVEAAGFTVLQPAKPMFGLVIALVRDPDGYLVELLEGPGADK